MSRIIIVRAAQGLMQLFAGKPETADYRRWKEGKATIGEVLHMPLPSEMEEHRRLTNGSEVSHHG